MDKTKYPDLQTTKALILEFEKRGADIIELGIPFSDPIADGPIIQASYYRTLVRGIKVAQILDMVSELRTKSEIPIVSMVSYSTVFKGGCQAFIEKVCTAGLDGLTIPDLPVEENKDIIQNINKLKQMTTTPIAVGFGVSTPEHAKLIGRVADGVIVGSAIIKEIEKYTNESSERLVNNVGEFVGQLILGAKG